MNTLFVFKAFNMKRIMTFFLIFLLPTTSFTEVIIQSPFTDNAEFQIYVSLKSDRETLVQKIFRTHPRASEREQVRLRFAEAMKLYLSGEVEDAQSQFRSFVSHSKEADWGKGDRDLFFNAYMRLAQLSDRQEDVQKWIQLAIRYDVEKRPSETMYPPPFQKTFSKLYKQEEKEFVTWKPSSFFKAYNYLVVNGKRYSTENLNSIILPQGEHRISAVSNKYGYWSKVLNTKEILKFSTALPPALVQGDCHDPKILDNPWTVPSQARGFFGKKCIKTNIERLTEQNEISLAKDNSVQKAKPKTLWILIGASLITSYFIIKENRKPNRQRELLQF